MAETSRLGVSRMFKRDSRAHGIGYNEYVIDAFTYKNGYLQKSLVLPVDCPCRSHHLCLAVIPMCHLAV